MELWEKLGNEMVFSQKGTRIKEGGRIMKKVVCAALVLTFVLGFGLAYAGDARIPQEVQGEYEQRTGKNPDFYIWFPVAPELRSPGWQNILILSNFGTAPIQVGCSFTSLARTQTFKLYDLLKYEKRILLLQDELGTRDDVYDIFCQSVSLFGAALLLLENGGIVTAWPPVVFY